jgi:hypothetical protein
MTMFLDPAAARPWLSVIGKNAALPTLALLAKKLDRLAHGRSDEKRDVQIVPKLALRDSNIPAKFLSNTIYTVMKGLLKKHATKPYVF